MRSVNVRIGSVKHDLNIIQNNKISISAFDDKRFSLDDGISCLPFGHFETRDIPVLRAVAGENDYGEFGEPEETLKNSLFRRRISQDLSDILTYTSKSAFFNAFRWSAGFYQRWCVHHLVPLFKRIFFSLPERGFDQRINSESALERLADFDADMIDYSQHRRQNPLTDDEAEEVEISWESFDSDTTNQNCGSQDEIPRSLSFWAFKKTRTCCIDI